MTPAWEALPTGASAALARQLAGAIPELVTDRLCLRAPAIGDFDAWAEIACSARGVHIGGPMSRDDAFVDFAQTVAGWLLRGHGVWSVEPRDGGAVLGFVLLGLEPGDREPELGYLFRAAAEGRGYATEAAAAARDHAFGTLGWSTLVSYIDARNDRSIAVARRLGALPDPHELDGSNVYRHPNPARPA